MFCSARCRFRLARTRCFWYPRPPFRSTSKLGHRYQPKSTLQPSQLQMGTAIQGRTSITAWPEGEPRNRESGYPGDLHRDAVPSHSCLENSKKTLKSVCRNIVFNFPLRVLELLYFVSRVNHVHCPTLPGTPTQYILPF